MKLNYLIKSIKLILKYNKIWLVLSFFNALILGVLPIILLWVTKSLINDASGFIQGNAKVFKDLLFVIFLQFILFSLQSIINNLSHWINEYGQNQMDYYLGRKISEKAISVPYDYFEYSEYHNHHERVSQNSSSRIMKPVSNFLIVLQYFITLISYIIFLINIHWILAVLSLVAAIPIFIIEAKYGSAKFGLMRFQTQVAREANYTNALIHDRQVAKEIRLFNLGFFLLNKWSDLFQKNSKKMLYLIRKERSAYVFLDLLTALLYTLATFFALWLLTVSKLNLGQFVVITQAVKGAQSSINMIASHVARIYEDQLYIEDLFNYLEFKLPKKNKLPIYDSKKNLDTNNNVILQNVFFKYPESTNLTLNNINLTIYDGETIAIVGENGSGKSTLVKCLMGLYSITEGSIFFNGKDISVDGGKMIRDNTAVVFQDFMKYAYSIRDNIAFGNVEEINNYKKIEEVATLSGIEHFVEKLPEKYETKLGKILASGEDLSGGQWQKLALARALFKDSKIIILDEPTSSLDPVTELEVYNQFKQLTKNKTTIYISHRMAAAKMADRIIVMKNGKIVEIGTHNELMGNGKEYMHMFHIQAKWYA